MKIGILGSGDVSKTLSIKLSEHHDVMISTRDTTKHQSFLAENPGIQVGTYHQAAQYGELIINALPGTLCVNILKDLQDVLTDKVLIDLANPLDFSKPAFELSIANNDSLGELIQRTLPKTYVVKTLNTVSAHLMVHPNAINQAHDVFVCGNDNIAKQQVVKVLKEDFGWHIIHDLGDIQGSRAMESLMHIWLKLWKQIGHTSFNFHIAIK